MSTTVDSHTEALFRELDYRETNGIEVSLLWNASTNTVSVHVFDSTTEDTFEVAVDRDRAREAFLHPFTFIRDGR